MKVAVLIDTWFPTIGGGQINCWEISRRVAEKGIKIDIITRNVGKDNLPPVKNLKVIKLGTKSNPHSGCAKIFFLVNSFLFLIRSTDYQLVHAHAFLPGITARIIMVFKKMPTIFTVHGTSINTKLKNPFERFLEKFILTQIKYSAQITVSRDFLKVKNVNQYVAYIPNGVDVNLFDKVKTEKFSNPTLIFVGRLHPQKNLKTLIFTIEIVRKIIPKINLLIIGEGSLRNELLDLIKEKKLQKNVKLLGRKKGRDLIKLYKSSHIFILPSIYEGQPLTLFEAWAAKLPVVVSRTGDCRYLVKNGYNGYLINNQYNPSDIAKIIKKALENKKLQKLSVNGYNFAKENFSWKKSAQRTIKIYHELIET